jgi:hypothetical protein
MNLIQVDKQYTPDEPQFIHLEDFEGEKEYDQSGEPVGFYAMGAESDAAKKFAEKQMNKARIEYKKNKKEKSLSIDDVIDEQAKRFEALLTGWSGFWADEEKGEKLDFNHENIMLVLKHPKLNRYRVQLENFTSNPLNYTKK